MDRSFEGNRLAGLKTHRVLLMPVIGFGLYIAGTFGILFDGAVERITEFPYRNSVFLLLALLGLLTFSLCALNRRVERLCRASTRVSLASAAFGLPLMACGTALHSGIAVPTGIEAALWFLFGASSGMTLVSWGAIWTHLDGLQEANRITMKHISVAVILGGALCFALSFAPGLTAGLLAYGTYLAAAAAQCAVLRSLPAQEDIEIAASKQRFHYLLSALPTPLASGFYLGALAHLATVSYQTQTIVPSLMLCLAYGSLLLLLLTAAAKRVLLQSTIERIVYPVLGTSMALWPYIPQTFRQALFALCIAALAVYFVSFWNVLVALSYRHRTLPTYHYAMGLAAPFAGIALGWALGLVLLVCNVDLSGETTIVCTTMVIILLIAPALKPPGTDKFPDTVGEPLLQLTSSSAENNDLAAQISWKSQCAAVCNQYRLTPRESEILPYLARGRNAEHIGKELFITVNTVKSHIGRIYRKLGVTSQQDLMDLVEKTAPDNIGRKTIPHM